MLASIPRGPEGYMMIMTDAYKIQAAMEADPEHDKASPGPADMIDILRFAAAGKADERLACAPMRTGRRPSPSAQTE